MRLGGICELAALAKIARAKSNKYLNQQIEPLTRSGGSKVFAKAKISALAAYEQARRVLAAYANLQRSPKKLAPSRTSTSINK